VTHFVGVPLVTFAIFLFLAWLRFAPAPEGPYSGTVLFYLVVFLYYLALDRRVALLQSPSPGSLRGGWEPSRWGLAGTNWDIRSSFSNSSMASEVNARTISVEDLSLLVTVTTVTY
jgi:hypothetical protein